MNTDALVLVAGGARSGKSAYAEALVANSAAVHYVATYDPDPSDIEMATRIAMHRARRPAHWHTHVAAYDLPATLAALPADATVLVDCLSIYVANVLVRHGGNAPDATAIEATLAAVDAALAVLRTRGGLRVAVTNEVGMGVVPTTPLGRAYRDALGWANQRAAAAADRVVVMELGIARTLKE